MRKILCDNCGIELSKEAVNVLTVQRNRLLYTVGEYCCACQDKIEKLIKEGVN